MAKILSGIEVRDELKKELVEQISTLGVEDVIPKLVIIQIGDIPSSTIYVENKKKFGASIGVLVEHEKFSTDVTEEEIIQSIQKNNSDKSVHGIIVQLPIPEHLDKDKIIESIDSKKDVDGLTAKNIKALVTAGTKEIKGIVPATTRGIIDMLDFYKIPIEGKKVVVIGRSALVGRPTAALFLNRNATVTVCHAHTVDLAAETKQADIVVVATGHAGLIGSQHVHADQTIIDVGISYVDEKIRGDVDFDMVKEVVGAISPVPGGVGPMTIISLFRNLVEAAGLEKNQ